MEDEFFRQMEKQLELPIAMAKEMIETLGKEKTLEIVLRAYIRYQSARLTRGLEHIPLEKRDLKVYAQKVREIVSSHQGNIEILESSDKAIKLKVRRCIPLEVFKKHGISEMGAMFCKCDFEAIKAVNPKMRLIRTKTLSAGDDECNHIWVIEE
jgi:hypothetical protein